MRRRLQAESLANPKRLLDRFHSPLWASLHCWDCVKASRLPRDPWLGRMIVPDRLGSLIWLFLVPRHLGKVSG